MAVIVFVPDADVHSEMIRDKLIDRGVDVFEINPTRINDIGLAFTLSGNRLGGYLRFAPGRVQINEISSFVGIYTDFRIIGDTMSDRIRAFSQREWVITMNGLYLLTRDRLWINPLEPVMFFEPKLSQLKYAADLGFDIPDTIITTEKDEVMPFVNSYENGVALKLAGHNPLPFSEHKGKMAIYTSRLSRTDLKDANFDSMGYAPTLLQEYVEKRTELRAYVVGDRVFCAEIFSQSDDMTRVDWRKYPLIEKDGKSIIDDDRWVCKPMELGGDIRSKCIGIVRKLGLTYGAVDLIRTPENRYVFLEVNSMGAFKFIEERTNLGISDAIVELVEKRDSSM